MCYYPPRIAAEDHRGRVVLSILESIATQSKLRQENEEIGSSNHTIVVHVRLTNAITHAAKCSKKDEQVCGSDRVV